MAKFLGRLRLPIFAGDPTSASTAEAEIWYNSFIDQLRFKTPDTPPVSISMGARFNDWAPARWYMTTSGASATATITVNRVYAVPFNLARYGELNGIAAEITTAFATTAGNIRMGIYYADYQNTPTTLIADYGTVAASVGIKTWTPAGGITYLAAGSYFFAIAVQGASGTAGSFRSPTGVHEQVGDTATTPTSTFFSGNYASYYASTTQSGALPANFGTIGGTSAGPRVAVRFNN